MPVRSSPSCSHSSEPRLPILLVHGYNSDPTTWSAASRALLVGDASTRCFDVFDYGGTTSTYWVTNQDIGPALARRITTLAAASAKGGGAGRVVVVAHSMGGLATRCAAARSCNGGVDRVSEKIAELVTFGTPNLGSWLVGPGLHNVGRTVGSLLSASCYLSFNVHNQYCIQIRALGTSDATRAFKPDSRQLQQLPSLSNTVPVYALAARIQLYTSFFGKNLGYLGDGGDLIVLEDSATAAARKVGGLGGEQIIDCGRIDVTDWSRSAHSCWHVTETNDTRFLGAAAYQIKLVEKSLPPRSGSGQSPGDGSQAGPGGTAPQSPLSFTISGSCTTEGGTLTGHSGNFTPGNGAAIRAWYPDGRAYTNLLGTSRVRSDGSMVWSWPCAGDPAGTYTTEVVDNATGRSTGRVQFTIGSGSAQQPPPPPQTWTEQQGSHGANTFANYHNASGVGPRVDAMTYIQVSCKVYDPFIGSVNPDGYWYRIASSPWNNAYYVAANTFWNGDVPGQPPYTHNTDGNVPNC
jgi:pimeloyl-ACP methyl ester carboxylesterase